MKGRGGAGTSSGDANPNDCARSEALHRRLVSDFSSSLAAWTVILAGSSGFSGIAVTIVGVAIAIATMALTWANRGYSRGMGIGRVLEHRQLLRSGLLAGALLLIVDQLAELGIGTVPITAATLVAALAQQVGRAIVDHQESRLRRRGLVLDRILIVADEHATRDVLDLVSEQRDAGWLIVGITGIADPSGATLDVPRVGPVDDIAGQIRGLGATVVIVTSGALRDESVLAQLLAIRRTGVPVHVHAGLRGLDCRDVRAAPLGHATVLHLDPPRLLGCQRFAKRSLDLVVASTLLVLSLPVLALTACAIKIEDRGPVLFRQRRVGRTGVTFSMPKFRSMLVDAESQMKQLEHLNEREGGPLFKIDADPRVTRTGRVIRALSVDELPQLVSVLRGDMSLIGPRPALPSEVALFDSRLAARHDVRPGLTGLWQVEARDDESFEAYRRLDLFYVENWTLLLDFTILAHTVPAVVKRGLRAVRSRPPVTTCAPGITPSIPTTAIPTTAIPTTAIPTTAMQTTAMQTTAMQTTAMQTTAMQTTAVQAAVPTTAEALLPSELMVS